MVFYEGCSNGSGSLHLILSLANIPCLVSPAHACVKMSQRVLASGAQTSLLLKSLLMLLIRALFQNKKQNVILRTDALIRCTKAYQDSKKAFIYDG